MVDMNKDNKNAIRLYYENKVQLIHQYDFNCESLGE